MGRRTSKTINGTTTGFWYNENDVYAELTGATPSATYIRGLNIDEPYIRKGVSDEFYETDALGSALVLTNPAGASQTTYTYEAFGNTTETGTASGNAFQYTRRENDGTELYYYRARYYQPKMQRFLGQDPIGILSGPNSYTYVGNEPLKKNDPYGLYGVFGAAGGATTSFLFQLGANLYQTNGDLIRSLRCVNWIDVGISAAFGAVAPTFLAPSCRWEGRSVRDPCVC